MKCHYSTIFFLLITICSCKSIEKIQQERGFSDECLESYEYFRNHLQRSGNGFFEFSNYNNDSTELTKIKNNLNTQYTNNITCWLSTLHKEDVRKLWGKPHQVIQNTRNNSVNYYYYINTKGCTDLNNLAQANTKCGQLGFFFKQDGSPTGSGIFSIFEGHGSLE